MADTRVPDLLKIGPRERNREPDWLLQSLQVAVELEFSTIPPYLCGLWSIKDQTPGSGPTPNAYSLMLSVVLEEMVHMGLACNMLSAIGGTPRLAIPSYPGGLPGGVRHKQLKEVYLAGLTRDLVRDVFVQIEMPEHPVPVEMPADVPPLDLPAPEDDADTGPPTIGAFYDAIDRAFAGASQLITGERQITTTFSDQENEKIYAIETVSDAHRAIREIKEQGEGTSRTPDAVGFHELAHFYRFGELYAGRALRKRSAGHWAYDGDPIAFPDCWPMARVPKGGYSPDVTGTFDGLFTSVVANLETAWTQGESTGQSFLQNGVNVMFNLGAAATALMQIPAPDGGNYGPDFQLASPTP